jgi:curved DNA-binding protein CbpA
MRELYSVLNLTRRASSDEIKAAYWALAKRFHPDVNAGDKEAEQWTKEINRAYEILGNPDARAAYDLELSRQRAKAHRNFWSSAAIGAATFILTVGSISMAMVWKHHALQIGTPTNETLVANAPAQERVLPGPARSKHPERDADPSEPASASHPGPASELPASTSSQMTSTAPTGKETLTPAAPLPSSVVMEQAPKEAEPSAVLSQTSRTDFPEGSQVPRVPDRRPPPRTELANVVSPQVEEKQPTLTATVDQRSSGESPPRDGDSKAEVVGTIHKKPKKHVNVATVAGTTTPSKLQGSEREPRLVPRGATALRFPSADEPFVNLGVRKR